MAQAPGNTDASSSVVNRDSVTKFFPPESLGVDIEQRAVDEAHLQNTTIHNLSWKRITVTVKDRVTKKPKAILDNVDGIVKAGEICALMGPSGCGKTTLLNVLARREAASGVEIEGSAYVNGTDPSLATFRRLSSYVEQDDALIGSLTVRETMNFAARLAHTHLPKTERMRRIDGLLNSFGIRQQESTIIGTPIRKGISGGQKRRVSVASQLITAPKLLFLDEPTSGLDSAASWEVISFIKQVAKQNNLIVIASIHQPSTSTFLLFDKLLLLSGGKPYYFGPLTDVGPHFQAQGLAIPLQMNPAEFVLELMNVDFALHQERAHQRLEQMQLAWAECQQANSLAAEIDAVAREKEDTVVSDMQSRANFLAVTLALTHRSFIKSYRDVVAYGVRIAMYTGLAIMMGTVWLRLGSSQTDIQPFINAIFFGSAFMSFMAVAYVPAFLEDRATFIKERANGLYGAAAFMVSNFLIGIPYLFLIALLFSAIAYWLIAFQPTAPAFFTWISWLFLDLLAAESLVVLMSSLFPNFVIALALTAFANGLWMSVGGFLVPPNVLNVFWKYVFHYIDYQSYVFQGMMVNEFRDRVYDCAQTGGEGNGCHCIYVTDLASQCGISGTGVLQSYGYATDQTGQWVGIIIGIIVGYRLLGWLAMVLRK